MVMPPVPVSVAEAKEEAVPIQVRTVGNVEAFSSVGVKAQVGGQLLSVKFSEGATVTEGDLLFEIDSRPFREAPGGCAFAALLFGGRASAGRSNNSRAALSSLRAWD